MVNKKSERNNNRTSKKPAPSEGKLVTKSDKLIQNISKNTDKICKEQKDHIKLGLEYVRKNQESIDSGSLDVDFNFKNTHYRDGNNKFKPEVNKSLTN